MPPEGGGAGLSGCRVTLRLDIPLPAPAWDSRPDPASWDTGRAEPGGQLSSRRGRNWAWGTLLLLLAESQFQPKLKSDWLCPAPW